MLGIRRKSDWAYYALFQYFWILVILPKAVQLVCLGGLLGLVWFRSGREKRLDTFTLVQMVFLLIYGVSIVVNAILGEHALNRIFAAVNTWAITVVALLLYHLYRHVVVDIRRIGKYALWNLLILVSFWLMFRITGGTKDFSVLGHSLIGEDWINGVQTYRFLGYMDYGNLVIFCMVFFYPLALIALRGKGIAALALTVALFPVIDATNSRTGLMLYLLLVLGYLLFEMQPVLFGYYKSRKYALFVMAVAGALAVAVLCYEPIMRVIKAIMEMREGSNGMRAMIYTKSLQAMWERSPVIGIGIKDMLMDYPLGSHSTYIGVFYKSGVLGGSIYMISLLFMAGKLLLGKDAGRRMVTLKICIAAAMLLMGLEDVDGANWCVCLFYVLLALIQNKQNTNVWK